MKAVQNILINIVDVQVYCYIWCTLLNCMLQERCLKILIIIFLICCVLHHIQIWRNFVIWFVVCCTTFVLLARYILEDMLIVLRSYCFIDQGNCCTPIFLLPRFFNNVEFIDKLNSICWVLLIILLFPRYNAKWCVVRYKTIMILALVDIWDMLCSTSVVLLTR